MIFSFNDRKIYWPKKGKRNAALTSRYSFGNAANMLARGKNERHKAKACRNKINTTKTGMNCQLNGEVEKYLYYMFTICHGYVYYMFTISHG